MEIIGTKILSNLTEEQQEDIKQKFVHFDTDNNGKISINEIGAVFKAMGIDPQQEVLAKWLNDFDSNHDGELSFGEFLHLGFEMGYLTEVYEISSENEQNLRRLIKKLMIKLKLNN